MEWESSTTFLGLSLILIGIALVILPLVARAFQDVTLERIPWLILYIYRSDGFVFVTSPLLIIVSAMAFLYSLWRK